MGCPWDARSFPRPGRDLEGVAAAIPELILRHLQSLLESITVEGSTHAAVIEQK